MGLHTPIVRMDRFLLIPLHSSLQFCFHCSRRLQIGQSPDSRDQHLSCQSPIFGDQPLELAQFPAASLHETLHGNS